MPAIFKDRKDAGVKLAQKLKSYCDEDTVILGMPRGGVIVAAEIARILKLPMNIVVSRKIGAPNQPEYAIGAVASNDVVVLNEDVVASFGLTNEDLKRRIEKEKKELNRRINVYRGSREFPNINGRTVVVVDDGIATGLTAKATVRAIKKMKPKKIILAAAVCAHDSYLKLKEEVDEVVCVEIPADFYAVGMWYEDFSQTTDEEVIAAIK